MTSSNVHRNTAETKLTDSLVFRLIVTALFVAVAFALTGCSGSFDPKLSGGEVNPAAGGFKGHIQGGQAPIYNADVYIFQTGESGYPGPGVAANTSIISASGTGSFTGAVNGKNYGPYVVTDSNGNFSVSSFSCIPGAGVYLVSYGGQPIYGTPNSAASEMAVFGVCPANGAAGLVANNPFVNVTEVSTVAMAYAVGGFTAAGSDFSKISTSATNITAMQNAFTLAQQLFSVSTTGGANTSSATMPGAIFDAAKINLMANILADCINSAGVTSNSSPCYTLFQNATSNGTAGSGTIPTDTASAMINITHNVMSNVSTILALANNSYAPYTPTNTSAGADLSLTIKYQNSATMFDPLTVKIDSVGNVYVNSFYTAGGSVSGRAIRISPTAGMIGSTVLPSSPTFTDTAIDKSNNVFFATTSSPKFYEYAQGTSTSVLGAAASGSPFTFSVYSGVNLDTFNGFNIGPNNDLITGSLYPNNLLVDIPVSAGTYPAANTVTSASGHINNSAGVAETATGVIWLIDGDGSYITADAVSSNTLLFAAPNPNNYSARGMAIDSFGDAWVAINGSNGIAEATQGGVLTFGRYTGMNQAADPAIDGLQNIWMTNVNGSSCSIVLLTGISSGSNASNLTAPYPIALPVKDCANSSLYIFAGVAIDQGGNVWVPVSTNTSTFTTPGYVAEILGLAAPTIQPIALQETKEYYGNTSTDIRP